MVDRLSKPPPDWLRDRSVVFALRVALDDCDWIFFACSSALCAASSWFGNEAIAIASKPNADAFAHMAVAPFE